jgi:hypothetical protein
MASPAAAIAAIASGLALEAAGLVVWSAQPLASHIESRAVASSLAVKRVFID